MATTLATYPLESSKRSSRLASSRPPSIAVYNSSFRSRSLRDDDEPLYDMPRPVNSPRSPPISRVTSPTSPTYPSTRNRTLSPTQSRSRAHTPLPEPQQDELEQFGEHCRAWYFRQDEEASRLMTQTLATIPSSQRATYSRLQAAIRADYHATMAARRNAEFLARLRAVTPGGSLAAHLRTDPRSSNALKERSTRLASFLSSWCTSGMPGTKPFFEAFWAVMRLQVLSTELGGAGARRIEWEIDDAVFKEAAGKDFMLEAIDVLKGVLGFEESAASKRSDSWSRPSSAMGMYADSHQRSRSQPISALVSSSPLKGIATTTASSRARAPSDPFLDNHTPVLSRSLASSQPEPRSPTTPTGENPPEIATLLHSMSTREALGPDDATQADSEEYSRVWTAPDLPDSELQALLRLFPAFVGQRQLPRFPGTTSARAEDVEAAAGEDIDARTIRFGTGRIWVGSRRRSAGYRGGMWSRFVFWWRSMFCR